MPAITDFWSWFVENEDTYYGLHRMDLEDKTYHFERLLLKLQAFDPCLGAVLAGPKDLQKATLIISAGGNPDGFLYVNNLVSQAPRLPRWKLKAFIQPTEFDMDAYEAGTDPEYGFYGMPIKVSDIHFAPWEEEEENGSQKLDLLIFFKGYSAHVMALGYPAVRRNIYDLVQDLLGEKVLYQRVGNVSLQDPDPTYFTLPLYDLPGYLMDRFPT